MTDQKKLLVIDDESAVREAIADILETVEIEVLHAFNGQMGLDVLASHQQEIGAILLDMRMPGLSGAETLAHIRQDVPHLYVIASTGYSVEKAQMHFGEYQPDEILTKPYDIIELIDRVQYAMSQKRDSS